MVTLRDTIMNTMEFDRRLLALSDCPVMEHTGEEDPEALGGLIFNPHPLITAANDSVLAHEICHRLAGKKAYDVFLTAVLARDGNELFKVILNLLCDCYDERTHEDLSGFMKHRIGLLHEQHKIDPPDKPKKVPDLTALIEFYNNRSPISDISQHFNVRIRDHIDLIVIADRVFERSKKHMKKKGRGRKMTAQFKKCSGFDIGHTPKQSDYYLKAVAKYDEIIRQLMSMWNRNKYDWVKQYYGEINWRNLPGMVLGQKISLPVFLIFAKIVLSREIYLVIDRSGSTQDIKNDIMDTAVIITESLRRLKTPISILDVGVTDSIINDIDEKLKLDWFTPDADGGTPMGAVCDQIKTASPDSYLLIVTDGCPHDFGLLKSVLYRFPGHYMTFVIGSDYQEYAAQIKNVIQVEPHTIIKEMLHHEDMLSQ